MGVVAERGKVSVVNSSITPLGISGIFPGVAENVSQYSQITVTFTSDVPSALNGVLLEFSTNGTDWHISVPVNADINSSETAYGSTHTLVVVSKFFRVVYENNDTTGQAIFRLQTILHTSKSKGLTSRVNEVIYPSNDAQLIRPISDLNLDRNLGRIATEGTREIFGQNAALANSEEAIRDGGGDHPFPQTSLAFRIAAGGDPNDDVAGINAISVAIIYLDDTGVAVFEILDTAGASVSSTTASTGRRVNGAFVWQVGSYDLANNKNAGDIVIENTNGDIMSTIMAGRGISHNGLYTVPLGFTARITRLSVNISNDNSADLFAWVREGAYLTSPPYKPALQISGLPAAIGSQEVKLDGLIPIPELSDIYWTGLKHDGPGQPHVLVIYDLILIANNQ